MCAFRVDAALCCAGCLRGPCAADYMWDTWHDMLQMARENARANVAEARRNFHEARDGEQAKLAEMEPLRKAKAGDPSRVPLTQLAEFKDLMVKTEAELDQMVGCCMSSTSFCEVLSVANVEKNAWQVLGSSSPCWYNSGTA